MASNKKRPSSDELKGLLLEGNFGGQSGAPLPLTDPISTTQMVLKLDDIIPYDKNPRRERNPAYDDIKESIRSKRMLNNNFNVTRRPGDDKYMVESGGNTRLQILKELYQETGDEIFNTVHCLFVPWKSEAAVLSAHLIENEMRGDMTLIDKAYAVQELKRELEMESGKALLDREFTRFASEIGYTLSAKLLRRFNYALYLDQMIPNVLKQGLGGHKIDRIKKIEKAYADYCTDKTNQFDMIFNKVMSESDTDEYWDFDKIVRQELDERLAEATGIRENLLRLEVDAILFDRPGEIDFSAPPPETPLTPPPEFNAVAHADALDISDPDMANNSTLTGDSVTAQNIALAGENSIAAPKGGHSPEQNPVNANESHPRQPHQPKTPPIHILWDKGYNLAMKIARSVELDTDCVMPVKCGMGFYMEKPEKQIVNISGNAQNQEIAHTFHSLCWWTLFSIAEQEGEPLSAAMWCHTIIFHDLIKRGEGEKTDFHTVIGKDPFISPHFSQLFQHELVSDQMFNDLFHLIDNCRRIKKQFKQHEIWTIQIDDATGEVIHHG